MTDTNAPEPAAGTPEHAAQVTQDRHQATADALQWLTTSHLPPQLQPRSQVFYYAATELILTNVDSAELTKALNALTEAKDWAIRAGIRTDTGRAGSVPRPQTVENPPRLTGPDDFRRRATEAAFGQAD